MSFVVSGVRKPTCSGLITWTNLRSIMCIWTILFCFSRKVIKRSTKMVQKEYSSYFSNACFVIHGKMVILFVFLYFEKYLGTRSQNEHRLILVISADCNRSFLLRTYADIRMSVNLIIRLFSWADQDLIAVEKYIKNFIRRRDEVLQAFRSSKKKTI